MENICTLPKKEVGCRRLDDSRRAYVAFYAYLESCFSSYHSVRPAAPRSREQVLYWLLRKHLSTFPLLLMISLSLLPVHSFVESACADVSLQAILWASDRRISVEQMFPMTFVHKSSLLTLHRECQPSDNLDTCLYNSLTPKICNRRNKQVLVAWLVGYRSFTVNRLWVLWDPIYDYVLINPWPTKHTYFYTT